MLLSAGITLRACFRALSEVLKEGGNANARDVRSGGVGVPKTTASSPVPPSLLGHVRERSAQGNLRLRIGTRPHYALILFFPPAPLSDPHASCSRHPSSANC